jgi:4a-hydroxytetrahydrobiopterin dehydratase
MTKLHEMRCVACRGGEPPVPEARIAELLLELPKWQVIEVEGVKQLERDFMFPDFAAAMAFTNRVGEAAESEDHHPRLTTEWGRVTVQWWTHKIRGLHQNDFIMASKTDHLYGA